MPALVGSILQSGRAFGTLILIRREGPPVEGSSKQKKGTDMAAVLQIRDESTTPGVDDHVFEIEFPTETVTVRELIRARIYQEVDDFNRGLANGTPCGRFRGLVRPEGFAEGKVSRREVSWKKQFDLAIDAFERRRVLVIVGDWQAESLEEVITIGRDTEVSFLRLVPLVGG